MGLSLVVLGSRKNQEMPNAMELSSVGTPCYPSVILRKDRVLAISLFIARYLSGLASRIVVSLWTYFDAVNSARQCETISLAVSGVVSR